MLLNRAIKNHNRTKLCARVCVPVATDNDRREMPYGAPSGVVMVKRYM